MKKTFGRLSDGREAYLYTISSGGITAGVTDFGAHLVSLEVPDRQGNQADVVLGFDDAEGYRTGRGGFLGAIVGRSANRIRGAIFPLNGQEIRMMPNEGPNNLHSGPDFFHLRFWEVVSHTTSAIRLRLHSPHGDQGFPGNAVIDVTYYLDSQAGLHIVYDASADRDTVFNLTNHSYFNLAGHQNTAAAMEQRACLPSRFFTPADAESIPTGEKRPVAGTPFDFRTPKPIGRDIGANYEPLKLQNGYDHNFEVFCNPCAFLEDPGSGRTMAVITDCPGIQFYAGNFLNETGKGGVHYGPRTGVALETQFYPDALHHSQWPQPVTKAGQPYHSETIYRFGW